MTAYNWLIKVGVVLSWPLLFLIRVLGILSGYLVVPLSLPFSRVVEGTLRPFSDYPHNGSWQLEILPKLFWMWSNDEDGALGDKRGWWDANTPFGNCRSFMSKFWWLAVRNPFNNASRFSSFFACNITNKDWEWYGQEYVRDDFSNTGWQLVFATDKDTKKIHGGFYWVHRWGSSNRALVVQLGNKIYPRHRWVVENDPIESFKGFTFEINPFKDIS